MMVSRKCESPASRLRCLLAVAVTAAAVMGSGRSDMDQDRAECADQLVGLASCLPYVGGDAKSPTIDCCTGLKGVLQKSKKCLCILIKDRDDPNLGLKINATLALGLPTACHAPANISACVDLLHLPANSTDAKLFRGAANSTTVSSATATPAASANSTSTGGGSAEAKSHGGDRTTKRWWALEIVCGVLMMALLTPNRMWGA
ncbi:non-specific lipid transfer protein GPI-anchored 6 [Eucalyptus grandis]|uniref:non-specific lipid transfer protein GPI-anchored 6 n=1 Tax=Eucalyptus grandis TaxID=71139 RepID=UPI00192E9384|nr:non-specific lipid transfer protein GPI-anchored 6 [Eucalyptus grandis]XP_039162089.1 non-specific lipid transfer protein GPI-anchored 6 [Eucalyptus grandis]